MIIKQYLKSNLVYFLPAVFFAGIFMVTRVVFNGLNDALFVPCTIEGDDECIIPALLLLLVFILFDFFLAFCLSFAVGVLINSQRKYKIFLKTAIGIVFVLLYLASYFFTQMLTNSGSLSPSEFATHELLVFLLVTPSCWGTLFLITVVRFFYVNSVRKL